MPKVWKIAPGNRAGDWELFLHHKCIGIGWLPDSDYRDFPHATNALDALVALHGSNVPGFGRGASAMMLTFAQNIKRDDLIVANKGYNEVVGIGVVTNEYLPPTSAINPLRANHDTHRRHVLLVDWVIIRTTYVPPPAGKKHFFVQSAVASLDSEIVASIAAAYANAYPNDQRLGRQLKSLFGLSSIPRPDKSADIPNLDISASIKGEGRRKLVQHIIRERDQELVNRKKKMARSLSCEVCGFNSESCYGVPYCEVHHIKPLAKLKEGTETRLEDLAIVCANCHRIIHSENPPIGINRMKKLIRQHRSERDRPR